MDHLGRGGAGCHQKMGPAAWGKVGASSVFSYGSHLQHCGHPDHTGTNPLSLPASSVASLPWPQCMHWDMMTWPCCSSVSRTCSWTLRPSNIISIHTNLIFFILSNFITFTIIMFNWGAIFSFSLSFSFQRLKGSQNGSECCPSTPKHGVLFSFYLVNLAIFFLWVFLMFGGQL